MVHKDQSPESVIQVEGIRMTDKVEELAQKVRAKLGQAKADLYVMVS